MVVSELRGEKIDIIPWNPEPARFVAKALSPARVREVYLDDNAKEATVIVPDDQLALAIGKEGMNARLAARLTGWKVDIQSEREFAQAEAEAAFGGGADGEEFSGRCAAILANGKRCPNAAVPGTRFCGVPAHQELAKIEAETGTYAEGTVQPQPEETEAVAAEGEEAPDEEQVAEAGIVGPSGEMSPPDEPVTEPDPTPAPEEPEPETGPPVEPTAEAPQAEEQGTVPSGDSPSSPGEREEEAQPAS
jgi:transcription termination/antitermination protein NusA